MADRAVLFAWLCALLIAVAVTSGVAHLRIKQVETQLAGNDAVFLGTSLTRFALPDHYESMPLAEVGAESVIRLGLSRGTESVLLDLASAASNVGVRSIFIEVNPLVSQFADVPESCSWHERFVNFRRTLRLSVKTLLRMPAFEHETVQNDREWSIRPGTLNRLYPLTIGPSCRLDRWQSLVRSNENSNLYFIAMPRHQVARDHIGVDSMAEFYATANDFASELGAPLFIVDSLGEWNAENFIDQAHMSVLGSARFLQTLETWWVSFE